MNYDASLAFFRFFFFNIFSNILEKIENISITWYLNSPNDFPSSPQLGRPHSARVALHRRGPRRVRGGRRWPHGSRGVPLFREGCAGDGGEGRVFEDVATDQGEFDGHQAGG